MLEVFRAESFPGLNPGPCRPTPLSIQLAPHPPKFTKKGPAALRGLGPQIVGYGGSSSGVLARKLPALPREMLARQRRVSDQAAIHGGWPSVGSFRARVGSATPV